MALLLGLKLALQRKISHLFTLGDSMIYLSYLISKQTPKDGPISRTILRISQLLTEIKEVKVLHVLRSLNTQANSYANEACNLN